MENKFCVSCGQQLNAGAKFCPHCGASQPDEVTPNNAQNTINTQPTPQQPVQPQQPQQPVQPQQPQQPVQPQAPQQPNMQGQHQQQVPPTGQTNAQYQQQHKPNKIAQDFKKFKNTVPGQMGAQPKLGFLDSIKYVTANTFDFKTPETRKAVYWWATLGQAIILLVLRMLTVFLAMVALGDDSEFMLLLAEIFGFIYYVLWVASGISLLAAAVRRIRYITNNPWLVLVPFYDIYLLLVDYPQYQNQMYQQPNQMQQPYQQQNYQQPQQPVQLQAPQQPNNNDQNPPQN